VKGLRIVPSLLGFVLIAACQGTAVTPGPSNVASYGNVPTLAHPPKRRPLIYTSPVYVEIYTFSGKNVGELRGFSSPAGLCSDAGGNVYVTDAGAQLIYEYARGGSLPINVLDDSGQTPNSCAVDPTTGNIAVTNIGPNFNGGGNVLIFPPGSGTTGTPYSTPNLSWYEFCSYDSSGNLYVDGQLGTGSFRLSELPSGKKTFTDITLSGITHGGDHNAGGVQWDGQYLAAADGGPNRIYRIAISGSKGKVVHYIHLAGWSLHFAPEFSIQGKWLLFPFGAKGELAFYSYPAGGKPKGGFFAQQIGNDITVSL
jgi:hypothetical protein